MAYSPSPQPAMASGMSSHNPSANANNNPAYHAGHRIDIGGRSSTPTPPSANPSTTQPQQPLSKRDKRRNAMAEKLNDLTTTFSTNRDSHYRQQLQALQVDMNLIMQADPYADHPLEDMGEEIAAMVEKALNGGGTGNAPGAGAAGGAAKKPELEASVLAGRWYARFVDEVNNHMEDRDAGLTALENNYTRTLQELHWNNDFKVQLAKEEHRHLASTLRERLIQSITSKKTRLMREKEQLDLADSNALLLHPNQFSITNPASPGGVHSNRKTRHMRYRPGDMEDTGEGGHKRKRKLAAEDNDVGSPAPPMGRIPTETGTASPFNDARLRPAASQDAPAYSIERLFTEKELTMHFNLAQVATAQHFAALRAQEAGSGSGNEPNGRTSDQSGDEGAGSGGFENVQQDSGAPDDEIPIAAPEMDRTANQSQSQSQTHHATRSTRNGGLPSTLDYLTGSHSGFAPTSAAIPGVTNVPIAWLPLPTGGTKKTEYSTPAALAREDVEDDLARIERYKREGPSAALGAPNGADPSARRMLDDMCGPSASQSIRPALNGRLPVPAATAFGGAGLGSSAMATALSGAGGIPMSTQSSAAGFSDLGGAGGIPMSRFGEGGSSMGPGMMKRSASGTGMDAVGKRARNR
ncbi:MAG: hypothetical protein M4579_000326 [Chaenotheca gracillima]|nr:MAG: hypothetical protein M4579_000326 [Chaenotheca gracillima]